MTEDTNNIHPIDLLVGRKVRQARQEKAMSQQELGNGVGVTFQQIQKYERGYNRIGSSRLWEFSQILGKPVNWFFETEAIEVVADNHFIRFYNLWLKIQHLPQAKIIARLMISLIKDEEDARGN